MLFSRREGRVTIDNSRRVSRGPSVDPYAPKSPDYAERSKVTCTDIGGGFIREDIGAPMPTDHPRLGGTQ